MESYLIDEREIDVCSEQDSTDSTNCYCNCHSSVTSTTIQNNTDALKTDQTALCDISNVEISGFDCNNSNSTDYTIPVSEPSPPQATGNVYFYNHINFNCNLTSTHTQYYRCVDDYNLLKSKPLELCGVDKSNGSKSIGADEYANHYDGKSTTIKGNSRIPGGSYNSTFNCTQTTYKNPMIPVKTSYSYTNLSCSVDNSSCAAKPQCQDGETQHLSSYIPATVLSAYKTTGFITYRCKQSSQAINYNMIDSF
ncbi:hypothetical protein [Photobacterium leiognathi]|uniref:hypothetical protein n=1 Tax=Photobacterium leiognathi TaxID=553611 RepID=UPI0029815983|nr:hypothetical protein [Photobacterium leiognathi]